MTLTKLFFCYLFENLSLCDFLETCLNCLRASCNCFGLRLMKHWNGELIHKWFFHVNLQGLMHFLLDNSVFYSTITCYFCSFYCYLYRPVKWGLLWMWYSRNCWVDVQQLAGSHVSSCWCYQFCWHFLAMNIVVVINQENGKAVELKIMWCD